MKVTLPLILALLALPTSLGRAESQRSMRLVDEECSMLMSGPKVHSIKSAPATKAIADCRWLGKRLSCVNSAVDSDTKFEGKEAIAIVLDLVASDESLAMLTHGSQKDSQLFLFKNEGRFSWTGWKFLPTGPGVIQRHCVGWIK